LEAERAIYQWKLQEAHERMARLEARLDRLEVLTSLRVPEVVDLVRTDLANRPTEPMLVSFRAWYTKLWGNRGFLRSGSRQTTPVRVGVTCGSGISVVRVGRE